MAIRQGPCLDARSDQRDILILVSNLAGAYQPADHVDKGKNPVSTALAAGLCTRRSLTFRSRAESQARAITHHRASPMLIRWRWPLPPEGSTAYACGLAWTLARARRALAARKSSRACHPLPNLANR